MHPTTAIIRKVSDLLREGIPDVRDKVFPYRTLSMSEEMREIPAIVVTMGQDDPDPTFNTQELIGSRLTVFTSIADAGSDEQELAESLVEFRRLVHSVLMAEGALGYDWVVGVGYGGAAQMSTNSPGAKVQKELTLRWQVLYVCDRVNPNVPE